MLCDAVYPSIMMAEGLCFSTVVMDPIYDNITGVQYTDYRVGDKTHRFAHTADPIIPTLLSDLKKYRKAAKVKMAEAEAQGNSFVASIYNSEQLAYKVR